MKSDFGFSSYIGIDWSGAKAKKHSGLQLAVAGAGRETPIRICPPITCHWSRSEIYDYLIKSANNVAGKLPVLAGIDFAFAHPFDDMESYFPGTLGAPKTAAALWELVDQVNEDQTNLYGGAMLRHPLWGEYYLAPPNFEARLYQSRRRQTEILARTSGRSPSPTFKAVGPDNVSTGSLAGMRLLHQLKKQLGRRLSIWPFDDIVIGETHLVLVEIFPSLYFYRLGMVPAKRAATDPSFLNEALLAYDSNGVRADFKPMGNDADEADAIISAAALRYFDKSLGLKLPTSLQAIGRREGWIFGVPYTRGS